jgi:hypothetical protein
MPEITETTPRKDVTISGQSFKVAEPYSEGHVLSAGEASALNQTYSENIRNNMAATVKAAIDAGTFDLVAMQGTIDDYMEEYEFGVRTGGGRSGDPVEREAMGIAREKVREKLRKDGFDMKTVTAKYVTETAAKAIAGGKNPAIWALAKQRVEATKAASISISLDDSSESADAEATGAKKTKATA